MNKLEETLLQTLSDLQVRSEVETVLKEMVTDIEIASRLEERLQARAVVGELERRVNEQETALEESRAVGDERRKLQAVLADKFVAELWSLSRELGKLRAIKNEHEKLLQQHDEVLAKLYQTEEDLEEARQLRIQQKADDASAKGREVEEGSEGRADEQTGEEPKGGEDSKPEAKEDRPNEAVIENDTKESTSAEPEEKDQKPAVTATVVALDDDADEVPKLDELENEILMRIFGFLDALDILNTAQLNISMYSRVDSLFGLGAEAAEDTSTINTNDSAHKITSTTTATTSTTTSASTKTSSTLTPTVAQIPPAPTTKPAPIATTPVRSTTKSAASAPAVSSPNSFDGARTLFSSILQPRKAAAAASSAMLSQQHRRSSSESTAQPMNAAMANSMAAKLSDAELNAIIVMTERLKQKELLADKLVKENEELVAKLDGADALKQFLVNKVREMEQNLTTSQDNEAKIAQQIASDQEVIAFLDTRVQELEHEVRRLEQEKLKAESELARVVEQTEQKSAVMGDMLQFERERLSESEREWKATKKLLVKEVKNCRAQIVALQAERDGYREQNELLRKAVVSGPHSPQRDRFYA